MSNDAKVTALHTRRTAFVYVRQSSAQQVANNRESTQRQYALVDRAISLGWRRDQVVVIDEDLGLSGASAAQRAGFARMTAEVAMRSAGIVLGLEVSRLARNNADWYRLLDLCALTDTLIGDADGLYHPSHFNDRLVLGLKGTMSEAELHILRARLDGGIRNKAARGELRRGLPVGFVWGEEDGEVLMHPDAAVAGAIQAVFERFAEFGSARRVWLWFRTEKLPFPLQNRSLVQLSWVTPTYHAIHQILTNPVYAGAYTYGKSRTERFVDDTGALRERIRKLPQSEWQVLIPNHHPGYIDWTTYEANQARLDTNIRPQPHQPGGAVREGAALLQGLAICGHCGRRLATHYRGRSCTPGYHCAGKNIVNGRGVYCLNVGGIQIDRAVADAFLKALTPAALEATLRAAKLLEADHDAALGQWRLAVERARFEAERAERRYRAAEPENRLVCRSLEAEWERRLAELALTERELNCRSQDRPQVLSEAEAARVKALGADLSQVWSAAATTDRDRKALLRTLLEEVLVKVERDQYRAELTLRWRGGQSHQIEVSLPHRQAPIRTDDDTIELIRKLAPHYPDEVIAGVLNRQGRKSATGERFTAIVVGNLRRHRGIPPCATPKGSAPGELVPIQRAAKILGVAPSTIHRWLSEGIIAGEQITPAAPWQIRITAQLKARFVETPPIGYITMQEATRRLGVSRQTVLQRVKRGEIDAIHVRTGRSKGLRVKVIELQADLFNPT